MCQPMYIQLTFQCCPLFACVHFHSVISTVILVTVTVLYVEHVDCASRYIGTAALPAGVCNEHNNKAHAEKQQHSFLELRGQGRPLDYKQHTPH